MKKPARKVSKLQQLFKIFLVLIHDKDAIAEWLALIEEKTEELRPEWRVNHVWKRLKTGRELRMTAQIGYYDMDYIILDMGSDVNILTRKTWESMNKSRLDWFPIQLRLINQSKVLPIGRLNEVPVEVEGLRTYADFELIDIIDDTNPYPTLLGIV